jgi:hypothetical protein
MEELCLAPGVDQPRAGLLLPLLHLRDELETLVERVEELAVERGDPLAKVGEVDRCVHEVQFACRSRFASQVNLRSLQAPFARESDRRFGTTVMSVIPLSAEPVA